MDPHLINEFNQAVDRGDELVKRELMTKAGEITLRACGSSRLLRIFLI